MSHDRGLPGTGVLLDQHCCRKWSLSEKARFLFLPDAIHFLLMGFNSFGHAVGFWQGAVHQLQVEWVVGVRELLTPPITLGGELINIDLERLEIGSEAAHQLRDQGARWCHVRDLSMIGLKLVHRLQYPVRAPALHDVFDEFNGVFVGTKGTNGDNRLPAKMLYS